MKNNYEKILYNFNRISIPINLVESLCMKRGMNLLPPKKLFNYLNFENKIINVQDLFSILDVTKDGIKYNLYNFKNLMLSIYGIKELNETEINKKIIEIKFLNDYNKLSQILQSQYKYYIMGNFRENIRKKLFMKNMVIR